MDIKRQTLDKSNTVEFSASFSVCIEGVRCFYASIDPKYNTISLLLPLSIRNAIGCIDFPALTLALRPFISLLKSFSSLHSTDKFPYVYASVCVKRNLTTQAAEDPPAFLGGRGPETFK